MLRAIKRVLEPHEEGLLARDVRRLVERELDRAVPKSTIYDRLASNPAFERLARGRYRLRSDGAH